MDRIKSKRHKWIRRLFWLFVMFGVVLVLMPVWFPWMLRPVLAHLGIRYNSYQRIGYTHFVLTDLSGNLKDTRFKVQQAQCALPTAWIWERLVGRANSTPAVALSDGAFQFSRQATNALPHGGRLNSAAGIFDEIQQGAMRLKRVLPSAELTNCTIQVGPYQVSVPDATWRNGQLEAALRSQKLSGKIHLHAKVENKSAIGLSASCDEYALTLQSKLSRSGDDWHLNGNVIWRTNRATISALFSTNSPWPARAQLDCRKLQVPARMLHLQGYENLTGDLTLNVVSNELSLQSAGSAQPLSNFLAKGFSATDFSVAMEGNPHDVSLNKLNVRSPWLRVALTNSMTLTWNGKLLANPAQLSVSMDLSKFPGSTVTGQVVGAVNVKPRGRETPSAEFRFTGDEIHAWGENAQRVVVNGELDSPRLQLDEISARLTDGSEFSANGSFNYETRRITNGQWQFSGPLLKRFFPGLNYRELTAAGQMHGSLTNLSQNGRVEIKSLRSKVTQPVDADMRWSGEKFRFESLNLKLTAGRSILSFGGSADFAALKERTFSMILTNVSLSRGGERLYALRKPCVISFTSDLANAASRLRTLSIDHFDWGGTNREVFLKADMAWPSRGTVKAAFTNFEFRNFADFANTSLTNLSLAHCNAAAHWSNGPVRAAISVNGAMSHHDGEETTLHATVDVAEQLRIKRLALETGYTPVLSVTGSVPVEIVPGRNKGWLLWHNSQALALNGNWENQETNRMSLPLGKRGRLQVLKPRLHFQVSGTPEQPLASLNASAAAIVWRSGTNRSHSLQLTDLDLRSKIQRQGIALETLITKLAGQEIHANGEWSLSTKDWKALAFERKLPGLTSAHGQLEVPHAQLSALSDWLPKQVAPEGQLSAKVKLKTGEHVEGFLSLTNAATRPLGKLTPLRNIDAQVQLKDEQAVLKMFFAQVEDQPIRGSGFVDFSRHTGPDYQLELRGTNVPLVQSLQLLLRGDFAIELRGSSNLPPVLSGNLDLHNGLFLMHTSSLILGGTKRPQMHPPYFSITNEPVANWKLDFAVTGDRFLRARLPVFNGLLSANLKLSGTMRAPILTGDAHVNSGDITLPFGDLSVRQAYASFTGNDPQGPDLQINASGQNYGYDVQLDVKGPADNPELSFSSTPPLSSKQILLMLTAGNVPQNTYQYSTAARAGRLATFLGKDFLSRLMGGGEDQQRFIIRSGEGVSETGRLTYSVEYRISKRWSIIGEYDQYNNFNTDLKWKILTR